ncbi:type VI secretion system protein ImpF [Devosia sp. UYZn731]|uniref:type VI secretion system baseplate subunit TssE n=1 Tax=Devosia sp. UYZn731 TaxID=3156345 RepID=UPI003393816E
MFAFRDAFERKDATGVAPVIVDGEHLVADRGGLGQRGARRSALKRDLGHDLSMLVETIALESTEDLSELPHVRKSIINFGIPDVSSLTVGSDAEAAMAGQLQASIQCHETRLRRDSVSVERTEDEADAEQRTRYRVRGEMASKPLDLPVEFVAEIDAALGKVLLSGSGSQ